MTIVDFSGPAELAETFARLDAFRAAAVEELTARFPALGVSEDMAVYEPGRVFDPVGDNAALRRLADFYGIDKGKFVLDSERLLAAFAASGHAAWGPFLCGAHGFDAEVLRPLLVSMVTASESAGCERVFARVSALLSALHEQQDGQLLEQYLRISNGPTFLEAGELLGGVALVFGGQ